MTHTIIHKSQSYQIEVTDQNGPELVVFFAGAAAPGQSLRAERKIALTHGLRAAFVTCTGPDRHDGALRALAHLRRLARGAQRVVFVGAELGAYAALAAARFIEADHVLALSPVATLDPRSGPCDWRFDQEYADLTPAALPQAHRAHRYTVLFDPGSAERRHVEHLALPAARRQLLPLACSLGSAREVLASAGAYERLIVRVVYSRRLGRLPWLVRQARRSSMEYFHRLAARNLQDRPGVSLWALNNMQQMGFAAQDAQDMARSIERAAPELLHSA